MLALGAMKATEIGLGFNELEPFRWNHERERIGAARELLTAAAMAGHRDDRRDRDAHPRASHMHDADQGSFQSAITGPFCRDEYAAPARVGNRGASPRK
jgi:hypothetical protein